jgi:Fe-S cluster biogenesis protein NfuA
MTQEGLSPETLAAHACGEADPLSGALVPPIHPSTIYEANPDGTARDGIAYTRADNPTYDHAERLLAALEGGAACMLFASGSAAATAVFQSLLPGDHVLVSRILSWGIRRWLAEFGIAWGLDVEFVDTSDMAAVRRAIRPGRTRLLWLESPANPTWDVVDLAAMAEIAHAVGARVAVDNTVLWPGDTPARDGGTDLRSRVQRVLDEDVNRAVAAHGGHVTFVDATDGRVRLRLEGGCQGCSLAEVTLRQGIEPLLRRQVPEVIAVVDATDHSAAIAPFFAPGKR